MKRWKVKCDWHTGDVSAISLGNQNNIKVAPMANYLCYWVSAPDELGALVAFRKVWEKGYRP